MVDSVSPTSLPLNEATFNVSDLTVLVNSTDQDDLFDRVAHLTKAITLILIICLAIFSNLLVILSIFLYRRLRGINNYFLVSLALADLLVACCAMTLSATQEISGRWIFGGIVCDLYKSIDVHASTVSTLHLCCISLDRYYAIIRPLDYQTTITTRVAVIMIILAWVVPAFISFVPIFLGWYTTQEHNMEREGDPLLCEMVVNKPYMFISSSLTFWCPMLVMLITYQRVYREAMRQKRTIERFNTITTLNSRAINGQESPTQTRRSTNRFRDRAVTWRDTLTQSNFGNLSTVMENDGEKPEIIMRENIKNHDNKRLPEMSSSSDNSQKSLGNVLGDVKTRARLSIVTGIRERRRLHSTWRREHKAFVTLGVVLGAFLVCWLPFFTWYLTSTMCGDACNFPSQAVSAIFWIGYFNSTLNPVIYAMTNQDFKVAFISILKRIFCCKKNRARPPDM